MEYFFQYIQSDRKSTSFMKDYENMKINIKLKDQITKYIDKTYLVSVSFDWQKQ